MEIKQEESTENKHHFQSAKTFRILCLFIYLTRPGGKSARTWNSQFSQKEALLFKNSFSKVFLVPGVSWNLLLFLIAFVITGGSMSGESVW